ncbi:pyridoxamine 5'-phosphate oxidase family protein [Halorientalis pallida]|uniref:Pyridoxamine 5'-phosphate oxidase family protein n=1 Tax=Halorientalis pallida TaxID=2479928 RepID=A0A498L0Z2_9EURY|nr:pyridoxamine 5'-phosphate oxidase family protein [Halorientalis pallida]RXK49001.1 pyridoxamine 5'-phosphate oxidase family protein [Halorientalis pallida]
MQGLRWTSLTDGEIETFLGRGGVGALSFATGSDRPPVLRPVSYGYNAATGNLFFKLSVPSGAEKRAVLDNPVAFTTFGRVDGRWWSVVATGSLEVLDELPYDASAVHELWDVRIPAVDIFDRPRDEVAFRTVRLVPDRVSGRREVPSE